jgi:hypothetical protein
MGTVIVESRHVYGVEHFYPVNETAFRFIQLTGTKTLRRMDLKTIVGLGFKIEVEQKELAL